MWNTLLVNFKTIYFYLHLALLIKGEVNMSKGIILYHQSFDLPDHYFETCDEVGYIVQYVLCTGEIIILF